MDTKTNPRTLPQEAFPPPLEAFRDTNASGTPYVWAGFGWEGWCVDRAIGVDAPDAMQFCHDQGFIDHTTKTLYNTPLRKFCDERAPKCAKVLKKLGYPA